MTAEEILDKLKEVCKTRRIRWDIHNCSLCGCPVGYIFSKGMPFYDSVCDCGFGYHDPEPRTWEDVEWMITHNFEQDIVKHLIELINEE